MTYQPALERAIRDVAALNFKDMATLRFWLESQGQYAKYCADLIRVRYRFLTS